MITIVLAILSAKVCPLLSQVRYLSYTHSHAGYGQIGILIEYLYPQEAVCPRLSIACRLGRNHTDNDRRRAINPEPYGPTGGRSSAKNTTHQLR